MSSATFLVRKWREYRLTGFPLASMRNFSKFHEMSVLVTGRQMIHPGSPIKETASSLASREEGKGGGYGHTGAEKRREAFMTGKTGLDPANCSDEQVHRILWRLCTSV